MDTKLLKQKILDLAIRGKLVPQDPNDEPASVLLEKIKQEKQNLIKQGKIKKDKNESTIFIGDDKQHYEKFADGTIKNIENEIPFEIPDSWCWTNGYQLFLPMLHTKPNGIKFQYVDIDSVDNKTHYIPQIKLLDTNKAPSRASRKIDAGDTVFSMVRPYLENIAFIDERFQNAIASTGFFVCKTILIDKKYIYYLMVSSYTIKGLNCFMKGDNSPSINADNIFKFLFPLPPLSEQRRIVAKIEELFAQVDKIEEEKQSLLKLIDRTKDKILDLAMKGKLVKQDPNDEPASVLLEKIFEEKKKLAKEGKIKLSKDELLEPKISDDNDYYQDLPGNWSVYSFNNLFDLRNGFTPLRSNKLFWENGTMPWFTIEDKHNQGFKIKETKQKITTLAYNQDRIIPANSVLLCCTASIGEVAYNEIPLITNQQFNGITPKDNLKHLIYPMFVYYFCTTLKNYLNSIAGATTFGFVSLSKLGKITFPLPPFNEQKRIVDTIENLLNKIEQIKDSL